MNEFQLQKGTGKLDNTEEVMDRIVVLNLNDIEETVNILISRKMEQWLINGKTQLLQPDG